MRERDERGNNCALLGDGSNPATDHLHVQRTTPQKEKALRYKEAGEEFRQNDAARTQSPMDLKRKEIQNDPRYLTEVDSGLGPKREAAVTKARRYGNVRPLGGK